MQEAIPKPGLSRTGTIVIQGLAALLVSWALLWGALHTMRTSHTIDGTVDYLHASDSIRSRASHFGIKLNTPDGRLISIGRLYGRCDGADDTAWICNKLDFQKGTPIQIDIDSVVDPQICGGPGNRRHGNLRCLLSGLDQVTGIRVNGHFIERGWSNPLNIFALYALVAAAVWTLAFNNWKFSQVSWISIAVFLFVLPRCVAFWL